MMLCLYTYVYVCTYIICECMFQCMLHVVRIYVPLNDKATKDDVG